MKKIILLILLALCLGACGANESPAASPEEMQEDAVNAKPQIQEEGPEAILDWVDFIQWDGNYYIALDSAVLADPEKIGEKAGEVAFRVSDNINSTQYKVKNGDAAFWEPGTELYYVEGLPDLLAAKDPAEINGYSLYVNEAKSGGYPQHFKDLKLEGVAKIEIYDLFLYDNFSSPELLNTLEDEQDVQAFLKILKGKHSPQDPELIRNPPDPEIYAAVLHNGEDIARKFHIYKEGKQWLWYPWDREFLPAETGSFIKK